MYQKQKTWAPYTKSSSIEFISIVSHFKKNKKVSWRQLPNIYDSETRKTGEVWLFPVFDGEHEKKRF